MLEFAEMAKLIYLVKEKKNNKNFSENLETLYGLFAESKQKWYDSLWIQRCGLNERFV